MTVNIAGKDLALGPFWRAIGGEPPLAKQHQKALALGNGTYLTPLLIG